ncbi:MAG: phospholipase C [Myxococcales bacterium]
MAACACAPPRAPADGGPSLAALRAGCTFGRGDLAATTLADFAAIDGGIPIDHLVLVMQENRPFDHYFSALTVPGQTVDGAAPDATNPDPAHPGQTVSRFHQTLACFDGVSNAWDVTHREVDDGGMDGFAAQAALEDETVDPSGARALGYYDESDLPYYYALARAFAISDRHFCSVQGPTWPNRLFYMAGTSFGGTADFVFPPQTDEQGNLLPNLFTELEDAGISWNVYSTDLPSPAILVDTYSAYMSHFLPFSRYLADAQAGTLPSVSMVEASTNNGGGRSDEEPPSDFQIGQAWMEGVVAALVASPDWQTSALFLTWDEAGGLYDHVPPGPACIPDRWAPQIDDGGVPAQFDQLGLRVPLLVVSPYAKRGYVSHHVTDHTSILRFVEARFGLPALTKRDGNAEPPFDMFDFSHANLAVPPLPDAGADPAEAAACLAKYPK